jgi:hypothetical protein
MEPPLTLPEDDPLFALISLRALDPDAFIDGAMALILAGPAPLRWRAAQLLSEMGGVNALHALLDALDHPDADVRAVIALALPAAADGESDRLEALTALLSDRAPLSGSQRAAFSTIDLPPATVAEAAVAALAQIDSTEAQAVLRSWRAGALTGQKARPGATPSDLEGSAPADQESAPPQPPRREPPAPVGESSEDRRLGEAAPYPASQAVQFATYYPKEVAPDVWEHIIAYVYRLSAGPQVAADAAEILRDRRTHYREMGERARIELGEGALITATPLLEGFQFNPPSASVAFFEEWHRLDFRARARTALLNQAANGRITFTVEGVIVADIPLSIFVTTGIAGIETPPNLTNSAANPYPAIFCSYSHRDQQIVERVERAYRVLGLDYLRDVTALRSGQRWNDQLMRLIERADIFQLFWSNTAAESKYVRQEWEHALAVGGAREAFIRPVYWQQPMPPVPEALGHLHFAYQPDLAE